MASLNQDLWRWHDVRMRDLIMMQMFRLTVVYLLLTTIAACQSAEEVAQTNDEIGASKTRTYTYNMTCQKEDADLGDVYNHATGQGHRLTLRLGKGLPIYLNLKSDGRYPSMNVFWGIENSSKAELLTVEPALTGEYLRKIVPPQDGIYTFTVRCL